MLVLGGFHATVSPLDTLCAVFNVILKGEGEYAILDIVKDWESLISARKFVYNPQRITNLELLPFPARHLLPFDSVFHKGLVDPRTDDYGTTLTTSRGCPFNCSFCLPENTKVLTADMQWLHIQDIKVGDTVVGIDSRRRYASSRVTNTFKRQAEVYAIETEGGTVFSTKEHPWLMHNGWKSIQDIEDNLKYNARFDSTRAVLRKLSTPAIALKPSDDYKKGYIFLV